ncbi:hypothetical protein [Paenibacillus sp. SN-8-1]|uniref:hypothetical protein n=1 Tax=Paenibacillus sp. SN-8-1 TaxID=3435409 RepID=UPI003D9A71F1
MRYTRKPFKFIAIAFLGLIGTYFILNEFIILDRTNQELAIYDYIPISADVEALVEGTGEQIIKGDGTSTKIKILNIKWNKINNYLVAGTEVEVNEYFVVSRNKQVSGLTLIPGRSIYSMGTSYKRLKKGEQKIVHLKMDGKTNRFWIMPEELVKQ